MRVETCWPVHSRRSERATVLTGMFLSMRATCWTLQAWLPGKEIKSTGYSGVSSKYKFAMTKTFFLGLWKQKKSIGIETYRPIGWINKVIIHWEERLRSCFTLTVQILLSLMHKHLYPFHLQKRDGIKRSFKGRCSTDIYQDWKLWFLFPFVFLIPILMKQNKNDMVLQAST